MAKRFGWPGRGIAFGNENSKGPWGGRGSDGSGGGSGGSGGGPRNPWAFPPEGRRPRGPGGVTSLDEFLKRARKGGGGPGLQAPGGFNLWLAGAGLLVAIWILFTSIHPIGPQERGVVTLLGSYSRTLGPGIQFTLPAPISTVRTLDVQAIRTEDFPQGGGENLMLTKDQNIVDLAYSVRWDIKNAEDYAFELANPDETVRAVAESAMRTIIADSTLDEALGPGRTVIEGRVTELMQQILDDYQSGVRVQGVSIRQADPPAAVNDDFKAVTAAQQEAQANLNQARAYAQQVIAKAQGEAGQFDRIYEQYRQAPEVTRRRLYYETMEDVLARSNKTIVEAPGVTPYLPLPEVRRRSAQEETPQPQATPQAGAQ